MTLMQLPPTFCWTKMGAESGEALSHIILRKEWERRLGGGRFLWGIGQSLGSNAGLAAINGHGLMAVFSPMLSKPKGIDTNPGDVILWQSWVDSVGQIHPLPLHSFVTSRANLPSGRRKKFHYALVCNSSAELRISNELSIAAETLCNLSTGKALGASQVTAVVARSALECARSAKRYPVSFIVKLESPFFIKLTNPTLLRRRDLERSAEIVRSGDMMEWAALVTSLRSSQQVDRSDSRAVDMFQTPSLF